MANDPWISRVWREWEIGNLTRFQRDILRELARFRVKPSIFPSHALLAARARCSVRTVQRALQAARALGLVEWAERRIKAAWRSLRTSNRYVLQVPAGQVCPASSLPGGKPANPAPATTGHRGRVGTQASNQDANRTQLVGLVAMLEAAKGLPDLLAARRKAWQARGWQAAK